MKDPEFYKIEENWPQPADESCTLELEDTTLESAKRKRKKSVGKKRKKLSESLAGIVTAAVALIMLTSALPDPKDDLDDLIPLPDFDPKKLCSVCQQEDCPYFEDGVFGLRVSVEYDAPYVTGDDPYHMPGFVDADKGLLENSGSIRIVDGRRIVLQVNMDSLFSSFAIHTESVLEENILLEDPNMPACFGALYQFEDEKSGEEFYFFAGIVYEQDGFLPTYDIRGLEQSFLYYTFPDTESTYLWRNIDGIPNAQLQFCSNMNASEMEYFMSEITAVVIEDAELVYELGQTMTFTETVDIHRVHGERVFSQSTKDYKYILDKGYVHTFLKQDFMQKEYRLELLQDFVSCRIVFAAPGWNDVFNSWQMLNDHARNTGHTVFHPVVKLHDISVNGITYSCYIQYTSEPVEEVNEFYWVSYYCVPIQEPTIAVVESEYIPQEQLQLLLEIGVRDDGYMTALILDQINLR